MSLTAQQEAQLETILDSTPGLLTLFRSAGLESVVLGVQEIFADRKKQASVTSLAGACSLTVTDWAAISAVLATTNHAQATYRLLGAITAAMQAQDATQLGPLLVGLYAAVKENLGQ